MEIQESSTSLLIFIVQNMLDYAKIRVGKFRKNISLFSPVKTIKNVIAMQKEQAEAKGIQLDMVLQGLDEETLIHSDEQRLMQVILCL